MPKGELPFIYMAELKILPEVSNSRKYGEDVADALWVPNSAAPTT
jgi:hypothetical protein